MNPAFTIQDPRYEQRRYKKRVIVCALGMLVLISGLIMRLAYLQLVAHQRYITLSKQNWLDLVPLPPKRGLIYDRDGKLLAENLPVYNLVVTPDRSTDLNQSIDQISHIIPISEQERAAFDKQLKQNRRFDEIPLKFKLTPEQVARFSVDQWRYPGFQVRAQLLRHYTTGSSLAHILGYVGRINTEELNSIDLANYSATNFIGKTGIEKYYEDQLHGQVGYQQMEIDASGRSVRTLTTTTPKSGANLYLTIDSGLQAAAEKAMHGVAGAVVALDPNSGEVLAMVSTPSFDPNVFVRGISQKDYDKLNHSPKNPLYNRAVRGRYPPASTIKPFLGLAGLANKAVTPKFQLWDPGWYRLNDKSRVYRDWKPSGHGWVNLRKAIVVSCDVYFYDLARKLGIRHIDDILAQFGFGQPTGLDLGEEITGILPTPEWKMGQVGERWYMGDTLQAGIGQGYLSTTPIQLATAVAALANRGQRVTPHLLLKQIDSNNNETEPSLPEREPVILPENSWAQVIGAMRGVIENAYGTGLRFGRDAKYTVAAKTGTAQIFSRDEDEDFEHLDLPEHLRNHHLFIAFAPVDHPKIVVAVVTEHTTTAPQVTRAVMDYYLVKENHLADKTPTEKPDEKTAT